MIPLPILLQDILIWKKLVTKSQNVKLSYHHAQSLTFFYLRYFSHFQNYGILGLFRDNVKECRFFNIFKFHLSFLGI